MDGSQSKTAFVTGGTGFVGSHLVEALQARGYGEIRCLVRKNLRWLDGLDVTPVHVSLDDVDGLKAAVEGVDYVYHVAGDEHTLHGWVDLGNGGQHVQRTAHVRLLQRRPVLRPRHT
ncbi:MAG: NAD-dependent epimerase/dehydratase family protein, partial [Bacteroidota bacterium]